MAKVTNILIVGVGGQGTILASRVLAGVVQKSGYDVKVSEIHGMAQRGGSVVTQVRFGEKVYSPIIQKGLADYILAFEKLEALRWLDFLDEKGKIIINNQRIDPMPVITGLKEYPDEAIDLIKKATKNVYVVNALKEAIKCGNVRTVNIVLLGVLSNLLKINKEVWLEILKKEVPSKFLEVNLKAFESGRKLI